MTKESLDSDRVNYMIWRYLLDSGYQETAVRLQKEWNARDPQELACAPHVPNHALVNLLNKGLLYNDIDRDDAQVNADGEEVAVTGFFGPLTPTLTTSAAADGEDLENARKRQIDHEQPPSSNFNSNSNGNSNGPPSKRPRLSNGYENGFEGSAMDLDDESTAQNGDENAYPSPEQVPSPVVVTVGPEQGTQVEKVSELATETIFLELSDDQTSRSAVLLQCEWNPRNAKILAAAGTDALARMWTISNTPADVDPEAQGKPQFQPHHNLLPGSALPTTTTSGLAWTSDGERLAVASEPLDDGTAKIEYWNVDGTLCASFNTFESPVIFLRWNPTDVACLSLSPINSGQGTAVTVTFPNEDRVIRYVLPEHCLHENVLEAAWIDVDKFVLCGGDVLQVLICSHDGITPGRKYDTREGHSLSKVTFDFQSQLLATASDTGRIDIWDNSGASRSFDAHQGVITTLSWQPLIPSTIGAATERLLASAGEDGAISIWDARSPDTKCKRSMTLGSSVVSVAFSPDGAFLAGGTTDRILIWKVDDPILPRASWIRGDQLGWSTPTSQDSSSDENQYSLCWNADGKKIAYGVSTSLAVINFRR